MDRDIVNTCCKHG